MALIDPDAAVIMALMNERLTDQETIARQQQLISRLTRTVVRQAELLADLTDGHDDG